MSGRLFDKFSSMSEDKCLSGTMSPRLDSINKVSEDDLDGRPSAFRLTVLELTLSRSFHCQSLEIYRVSCVLYRGMRGRIECTLPGSLEVV